MLLDIVEDELMLVELEAGQLVTRVTACLLCLCLCLSAMVTVDVVHVSVLVALGSSAIWEVVVVVKTD